MIGDSYNLAQFGELELAIRELRGYWKLWSACLLRSVGLSTPRGLIVTRAHDSLERDLHKFLRDIGAASALIRHDRRKEAPPYPRGGFLVPQAELLQVIQSFLSDTRIVAVYEPLNRLQNGHNLNLLFRSADEVLVEVAGPGFDASNLQRGDITPHEILTVQITSSGFAEKISVVHRTTDEEYRRSVTVRIDKLREFPKFSEEDSSGEQLRYHLMRTQTYQPISRDLIKKTLVEIVSSGFIQRFIELTGVGLPINISTSYVDRGERQIFWDAMAPSLKFEGLIPSTDPTIARSKAR